MGEFLVPVLNQIGMLFIIAAVGLLLRKMNVLTDPAIKGINGAIVNVTWPAMALMAMLVDYTPEVLSGFLTVMVISIFAMSFSCLVGYLFFRKHKDKLRRPVLISLASLPNAGFIGMPIAYALYGDLGVLYMAAFLVGFNLLVWTAGASMFTGFGLKTLKGLVSPGFIGIVIGLVIFLLKIKLPAAVESAIVNLGQLNTPLAMMMLGARMDTLKLSDLADKQMWGATALKLVIIPLMLYGAMRLLGFEGILLAMPVMMTAMPAASACQILSERYEADNALTAKGISLSTLMCSVTVPLLALLMG
ncbi:MAG: AEC family transporter [Christensenellales bacterium]|jgi:predicted permease